MYLCVQMKVKARYIRIGAVALLTLFVAYYAISTLYAHVHEVNGTFIVHSIELACPDLPLLCLLTGSLSAFHALSSFGDGIYLRAPPVYLFI